MKVRTDQSRTFADDFIEIPESDLDGISLILNQVRFGNTFSNIRTDYPAESLFRALLLRELYDKGADSAANRKACAEKGLKDGIMRRKSKGRKREKERNRLLSKRCFVVECTFGTMKRTYGMSRAKLTGLAKVTTEAIGKAIAYNLRRAANRIVAVNDLSCLPMLG